MVSCSTAKAAKAALTSIAPCISACELSIGERGTHASSSAEPGYGMASAATGCASCDGRDADKDDGRVESSMRRTAESVFVTVTRC